jgi:hypothetical protein
VAVPPPGRDPRRPAPVAVCTCTGAHHGIPAVCDRRYPRRGNPRRPAPVAVFTCTGAHHGIPAVCDRLYPRRGNPCRPAVTVPPIAAGHPA